VTPQPTTITQVITPLVAKIQTSAIMEVREQLAPITPSITAAVEVAVPLTLQDAKLTTPIASIYLLNIIQVVPEEDTTTKKITIGANSTVTAATIYSIPLNILKDLCTKDYKIETVFTETGVQLVLCHYVDSTRHYKCR
jgi:hypothetical protein